MGITRKYDTDEFKQEAVKLVESVGVSQAANCLKIIVTEISQQVIPFGYLFK